MQLASHPSFELRLALRPLVHQPQVVLGAGVQVPLHIRLAPPQRLAGRPGGAGGAACGSGGGHGCAGWVSRRCLRNACLRNLLPRPHSHSQKPSPLPPLLERGAHAANSLAASKKNTPCCFMMAVLSW